MLKIKHNTTCWDKACLVLTGLLLLFNVSFAQNIPARPVPPRLVNDYANILTDKQEQALESFGYRGSEDGQASRFRIRR